MSHFSDSNRKSTASIRMDIAKMISELEAEKERLDEAILALERLSAGNANRARRSRSRRQHSSHLAEAQPSHAEGQSLNHESR